MRMIVFFDLPVTTSSNRKEYRKFRKTLINNGYLMMQESVYSKLLLNYTSLEAEYKKLDSFKPKEGLVQCIAITEKQYSSIKCIVGEMKTNQLNSTERVIVI